MAVGSNSCARIIVDKPDSFHQSRALHQRCELTKIVSRGRSRPRTRTVLLVPRPAPLRHHTTRRLRLRPRTRRLLHHLRRQRPRRDPIPTYTRECALLILCNRNWNDKGRLRSPFFVGALGLKSWIIEFCNAHFLSVCLFLGFIQYKQFESSAMRVSRDLEHIGFFHRPS